MALKSFERKILLVNPFDKNAKWLLSSFIEVQKMSGYPYGLPNPRDVRQFQELLDEGYTPERIWATLHFRFVKESRPENFKPEVFRHWFTESNAYSQRMSEILAVQGIVKDEEIHKQIETLKSLLAQSETSWFPNADLNKRINSYDELIEELRLKL